MFASQVRLARAVSKFLEADGRYELLAQGPAPIDELVQKGQPFEHTHIIVLFRAKDEKVNGELVKRINSTRKMYVSGTKWEGNLACRIAVSTWKVDVERDVKLIRGVLEGILT
jgi:hypothetical protein